MKTKKTEQTADAEKLTSSEGLSREDAMDVTGALTEKELKSKNLSGAVFVKLLNLKRGLKKYLDDMSADEVALAEVYEVEPSNIGFIPRDPAAFKANKADFKAKLKDIQSKRFVPAEPVELNFIPQDEFKKWIDEATSQSGLVLATFLMKE